MDLPREVRQNILTFALTDPYKKDIGVISQRYYEEEESLSWDSYGNGELPLQHTYNLARRLRSAFKGNGLVEDELRYVLGKIVARVDVQIGRIHGGVDDAITKLANLIRPMIMFSLGDLDQKKAMGQVWCDDWECLSLEWIVYHQHKMDIWEVGKPTEAPLEGAREKIDRCAEEKNIRVCYLTGTDYDRDCPVDEEERWFEDLEHF